MANKKIIKILSVIALTTLVISAVPSRGQRYINNETDVAAQTKSTISNNNTLYAGVTYHLNECLVSTEPNNNEIVLSSYEDTENTENTEEQENVVLEDTHIGYVSSISGVNVREHPDMDSEILDVYSLNTEIEYVICNDDWVKIIYNDRYAYIYVDYISNEKIEIPYTSYAIPWTTGFKSYMSYKAITSVSSPQYKLQQIAYTGDYGIRMYNGKFCVAIGTHFGTPIGTNIDLVLENGTVIPCIVSDIKADRDTDAANIITVHSGCVSEFLVDYSAFNSKAKQMGDVSYCNDFWKSRVVEIRVYN